MRGGEMLGGSCGVGWIRVQGMYHLHVHMKQTSPDLWCNKLCKRTMGASNACAKVCLS
jgi:hypothetical protein